MNNDWSNLLYLFIRRVIKLTVVIVKAYYCHYLHTQLCQNSSRNCWGLSAWTEHNRSVTVYAAFVEILEKKWVCGGAVYQVLVGHTKACDSVRREVLFNMLI
jgi:hypothetical protein